MFATAFSILTLVSILSILGNVAMRIRVTKIEPRDKIAWWRRSSDEVASVYESLYPNSYLTLFGRFGSWLSVGLIFACVVALLWKSN
jgi:hypothetical protein